MLSVPPARNTDRGKCTLRGSGREANLVGEGAQGGQELAVRACDNVVHEGCSGDCENFVIPQDAQRPSLCDAFGVPKPNIDPGDPCRINPDGQRICSVSIGSGQNPEPTLHGLNSPSPRDFASVLDLYLPHVELHLDA